MGFFRSIFNKAKSLFRNQGRERRNPKQNQETTTATAVPDSGDLRGPRRPRRFSTDLEKCLEQKLQACVPVEGRAPIRRRLARLQRKSRRHRRRIRRISRASRKANRGA